MTYDQDLRDVAFARQICLSLSMRQKCAQVRWSEALMDARPPNFVRISRLVCAKSESIHAPLGPRLPRSLAACVG